MTKRFFIKVDKKVAIIDKQENHRIRDMYRACDVLNEQQATIKQLESDKAIAEDYANIFEKENVKLRIENKKLKEENRELRQSVEYWQKKYEEGTETFQID